MNLNNLKCLLDVVDAGSISQAARNNFMSQQALSDQIRRLEKHYQTPLLERTKPLRLTPAGEIVCQAARTALEAMDSAERRVARLREPLPRLVISTGLARTPSFLPRIIARFQEEMPQVEVHLVHPGFAYEEVNAPLPGADLIVGNMPFDPNVEGTMLFRDVLCIAMSEKLLRRLYGENWEREASRLSKGITPEEYRRVPMARGVVEKDFKPHVPGAFEAGTVDNMDIILYRCSVGLEAALLPAHFAGENIGREFNVQLFPVVPEKELFRVGIGVRKGYPVSEAARTFIRLAEEYFQKENGGNQIG